MNTASMTPAQRSQLVHMACVAAWSNLDVHPEEREVVLRIARQLELSADELAKVEGWLKDGPPDFDPYAIPREHREAYIETFMEVARADGQIDLEESETIKVLHELLD